MLARSNQRGCKLRERIGVGSVTGSRFFLGGGLGEKTFFRLSLNFPQADFGALVLPEELLRAVIGM